MHHPQLNSYIYSIGIFHNITKCARKYISSLKINVWLNAKCIFFFKCNNINIYEEMTCNYVNIFQNLSLAMYLFGYFCIFLEIYLKYL